MRVFSALSVVLCIGMLGGCTHDWSTLEFDPDEGMVLYLSLDDPSALAGGDANQTVTSDASASQGVQGGGLSFDGGQSVEVELDTPLELGTTYSVSLWFRSGDTDSQGALLCCHGDPSFDVLIDGSDGLEGRPYEAFTASWPSYRVRTSVTAGVWTHQAMTVDGAMVRLYVDGALADERVVDDVPPTGTNSSCYLGRSGYSWDEQWLVGEVDEVRVYNRTLDADEVEWLAAQFR